MIDESLLPFALIVATVVGTVIAVLIGRFLDRPIRRHGRILAASSLEKPRVIEFKEKGILLAPKSAPNPVDTIYEQEVLVSNIGFETIRDISVIINTEYEKVFEDGVDFADHSIETDPKEIDFDIATLETSEKFSRYELTVPFMNRGDKITLRTISSSMSSNTISCHMPETEFRLTDRVENVPTARDKLLTVLGRGRLIETIAGASAAAALAVLLGAIR